MSKRARLNTFVSGIFCIKELDLTRFCMLVLEKSETRVNEKLASYSSFVLAAGEV